MKKRVLFYLAGYDPRGTRHYYNLFKREAEKQAKIDGAEVEISERRSQDEHTTVWKVKWKKRGEKTETKFCFLEWDDLIRGRWRRSYRETFQDFITYLSRYILSGKIFPYFFKVPHQAFGFLFPALYVLVSLLMMGIAGLEIYDQLRGVSPVLAVVSALLLVLLLSVIFRIIAERLAIFWLLRVFTFSFEHACREDRALQRRIEEFVASMERQVAEEEAEEIMLVSHSVGTILTIDLLDKWLEREKKTPPRLSVLTLGECIPLVSGLDCASGFRKKMKNIAAARRVFWMDFTSVIDGACFPGLDFFDDAGVKTEAKMKPLYLSTRFHRLFPSKRYRQIKRDKYLSHFLYLMAMERKGVYNFYEIIFGGRTLEEYFGSQREGRRPVLAT